MKKRFLVPVVMLGTVVLVACGSAKSVMANDYSVPVRPQKVEQPALKKREVREVDKLAAAEKDKMRAVGIGNDYEEKEARREALRDAQATLAGYIETAVVSLTTEFHKKNTVTGKKLTETQIESYVETAVSQKISSKMIGVPEVYDAADGTLKDNISVKLTKTTDQVRGDVYDPLSKDEVLGADYDKQKFIQDNKDRIQELREKVK